ncbi:MAG TPA: hypothetical protein VJ925_04450 [Longimicrobiales bacterium]|nr:hypothetical protein [Longimicrobiales bacterium]
MRRLLAASLLLLGTLPVAVLAQTPGRAAPLLELAAGARAAGLGGASQLGVQDPDHLFAHPAFLGSGGFRLTARAIDGGATIASVAAGTSAFGGRIGVGVRAAEWTGPEPAFSTGGLDDLADGTGTGRSTVAATVGYVRDMPFDLLDLEIGATATVLAERADAERDRVASFDIGVGREIGPLDVALSARNLGADVEVGSGVPLPLRWELAAGGYGHQLGPLDLGVAGRIALRDDDEVVTGGGLEIGYYPVVGRTFIVRVGGQSVPEGDASPLTLGGTFIADDLTVDYAWRDVDGSAVHVISFGWR